MKVTCPNCHRRIRVKKNIRHNKCKCGYVFSHTRLFGKKQEVYLIDANVFIYAINKDNKYGRDCEKILTGGLYQIGTTVDVLKEIKQKHEYYDIKIYKIKKISPEVNELRYNTIKELSKADKSLIQCAIDYPEISGIITNDLDIKSVVPERLIRSETKFFIGRPSDFLKKKGMK